MGKKKKLKTYSLGVSLFGQRIDTVKIKAKNKREAMSKAKKMVKDTFKDATISEKSLVKLQKTKERKKLFKN